MTPLPESSFARSLRAEPNLTERVWGLLLSEITSGQYSLGDVLPPEQGIATRMGVSRTVLREAVAKLKAEGYVTSKQGRGLMVTSNRKPSVLKIHAVEAGDSKEALTIVELRHGFEITAASLAAQRRTEEDLKMMHAAVDRMRRAILAGDVAVGVQADLDFHRAIAVATRNDHYVTMFDFIAELYKKNLTVSRENSKMSGRASHSQEEHELLLAAIEVSDPHLARQRADVHVLNTAARLGDQQAQSELCATSYLSGSNHNEA